MRRDERRVVSVAKRKVKNKERSDECMCVILVAQRVKEKIKHDFVV